MLFVLIDSRLEPQKIDLDFINKLGENGIPFALVFTKYDKLRVYERQANISSYKQLLGEFWEELPPIFITSAEKQTGKDELLAYINSVNRELKGLSKK